MKIRFNVGGHRNSNKPKTEMGYYFTAAWCILIGLLYIFRLIDSGNFRPSLWSVITLVPFFIFLTITVVINLIKAVKMTRKRLENRISPENKREPGYIYCTQCGCKLLEGIEVCPYCNEALHIPESYETVRTTSFENASPEVSEKPNILLILSIVALVISIGVLIVYNVSNPYAKMDTEELYVCLEENLLDINTDSIKEIKKITTELKSRDLPEAEELYNEVENLYEIMQDIYSIDFPSTNEEGQALRDAVAVLILFDMENERWDLSQEITNLTTNRAKDLLVGTKWTVGGHYFMYYYAEDGQRFLSQNVFSDIFTTDKVFRSLVTPCEDGTVDISYQNVDDEDEVHPAIIIEDIYYHIEANHWVIDVGVPSYSHGYVMTEEGIIE